MLMHRFSFGKASGRLESWTGLELGFRDFFARLALIIEGPLGNASDAEGQALVSKPWSQQA